MGRGSAEGGDAVPASSPTIRPSLATTAPKRTALPGLVIFFARERDRPAHEGGGIRRCAGATPGARPAGRASGSVIGVGSSTAGVALRGRSGGTARGRPADHDPRSVPAGAPPRPPPPPADGGGVHAATASPARNNPAPAGGPRRKPATHTAEANPDPFRPQTNRRAPWPPLSGSRPARTTVTTGRTHIQCGQGIAPESTEPRQSASGRIGTPPHRSIRSPIAARNSAQTSPPNRQATCRAVAVNSGTGATASTVRCASRRAGRRRPTPATRAAPSHLPIIGTRQITGPAPVRPPPPPRPRATRSPLHPERR